MKWAKKSHACLIQPHKLCWSKCKHVYTSLLSATLRMRTAKLPSFSIVIGSVNGCFETFEKIAQLHKKNAFSVALIVGDLFGDPSSSPSEGAEDVDRLLAGKISIPLPTYFSFAKYGLPAKVQARLVEQDDELCSNLYFLGKRSVTKTSDGLRIVSLGGVFDSNIDKASSQDRYLPRYGLHDATALHGAHTVDILVTSQWPDAIRYESSISRFEGLGDPQSIECIANLCSQIEPRYHISTSPSFFFEREPFYHDLKHNDLNPSRITRFISLPDYGNERKQKWLYAFSIDLTVPQTAAKTPGLTRSPFSKLNRGKRRLDSDLTTQHRFSDGANHLNHQRPKRHKNKGPPPGPESCFFCLSNPNLQTQLITSIGNESYLTTAKGPLPTPQSFKDLQFPSHMLIIPLAHTPTLGDINPSNTRDATIEEMTLYRRALQSLVAYESKGTLGAVTWELSRAGGVHLHWQFMPVSAELVRKGLVEAGFQVEAETERYNQFHKSNVTDSANDVSDYLRIWLWAGEEEKAKEDGESTLVLDIQPDSRFDLQFPRRVMAKLLGLEDRMHWQDCTQTEDEELSDAEAFKRAFKRFEFT